MHLFGRHSKEHFGSLSQGFLTLFQTITLDDWINLLASASGSSPAISVIYFGSFILLGTMIMLNLFIGIIMNSMSEIHDELDEQVRAKQKLSGIGASWTTSTRPPPHFNPDFSTDRVTASETGFGRRKP